jgi:hypothetical protein
MARCRRPVRSARTWSRARSVPAGKVAVVAAGAPVGGSVAVVADGTATPVRSVMSLGS